MDATIPARPTANQPTRYRAGDLLALATTLLMRAGLPEERARAVAEILLEGDLLGHTTHGLALLAPYLRELDAGAMTKEGEPLTLADRGAAITWDGGWLPGPWLVKHAIATAEQRLAQHPVMTVVVRRSHHIGCLQAYLKPVTDAGLVLLLTCSDPASTGVAPHGGTAPRLTPNPVAAGIPTDADPILIDVSMSTTTNAMAKRVFAEGGRLPGPWLVDAAGQSTDDPAMLFSTPPAGAILPLGGLDLGHKGFALALLVEALTSGLAGHGRIDEPKRWGASVFVQVIDPDAFGGRDAFRRQMTGVAAMCHDTPVAADRPPVRLPGEGALARRDRQLREGIALTPTILPALDRWAGRFGVPMPTPMTPSP
jgi:LDH2 family malate/lactate/ureidoglycolate dehydrogenase